MKIIVFEDCKAGTHEYYVGTEKDIMKIFRSNVNEKVWGVIVQLVSDFFDVYDYAKPDTLEYWMLKEANLGYIEEHDIAIYCDEPVTTVKNTDTFTKEFEVTEDSRKHGKPFVAKLFWDHANNKMDREFFAFDEHKVKNSITIAGEYQVSPGDVIEIRKNVSWKNDWRTYYFIEDSGNDKILCERYEGKKLYRVKKYLQGKLTAGELFKELDKL